LSHYTSTYFEFQFRTILELTANYAKNTSFHTSLIHYSLNTVPDLANIYVPKGTTQDESDKTVKAKVKFALEKVTKAQRGSRGIALLFL
jgi:hypothetical protein